MGEEELVVLIKGQISKTKMTLHKANAQTKILSTGQVFANIQFPYNKKYLKKLSSDDLFISKSVCSVFVVKKKKIEPLIFEYVSQYKQINLKLIQDSLMFQSSKNFYKIIESYFIKKTFQKDEYIFKQNDQFKQVIIIKEGQALILKNTQFGLISIIKCQQKFSLFQIKEKKNQKKIHKFSLKSLCKCKLLTIKIEIFSQLLLQKIYYCKEQLISYVQQFNKNVQQITDKILQTKIFLKTQQNNLFIEIPTKATICHHKNKTYKILRKDGHSPNLNQFSFIDKSFLIGHFIQNRQKAFKINEKSIDNYISMTSQNFEEMKKQYKQIKINQEASKNMANLRLKGIITRREQLQYKHNQNDSLLLGFFSHLKKFKSYQQIQQYFENKKLKNKQYQTNCTQFSTKQSPNQKNHQRNKIKSSTNFEKLKLLKKICNICPKKKYIQKTVNHFKKIIFHKK